MGVNLQFAQFESVKPFYSGSVEIEEVPNDWTDEQVLERMEELHKKIRALCEKEIDEDILAVKQTKVFNVLKKEKK